MLRYGTYLSDTWNRVIVGNVLEIYCRAVGVYIHILTIKDIINYTITAIHWLSLGPCV
jgi:hypothetical protein